MGWNDPIGRGPNVWKEASEEELAQAATAGDPQARKELVLRLLVPIRRTISYLTGCSPDTDDLTQNALLRVLRTVGSFRGECSLRRWATRVAVRITMRELEKARRRKSLLSAAGSLSFECADAGAEPLSLEKGVRMRVSAHLQQLSAKMREVIVLHLVEGYTAVEIAAMTGTPLGTVKDRLLRGRRKLKKRLLSDTTLREYLSEKEG